MYFLLKAFLVVMVVTTSANPLPREGATIGVIGRSDAISEGGSPAEKTTAEAEETAIDVWNVRSRGDNDLRARSASSDTTADLFLRATGGLDYSTLERRGSYIKCDTTWGSPTFTEIIEMVNKLRYGAGMEDCQQENGVGSMCTEIVTSHGGSVSMCGNYLWRTECNKLAKYSHRIVLHCSNLEMGRAGGTYHYAKNKRVTLH